MTRFHRIVPALAVLAALATPAAAKDWSTIRIAMDATYPPFESLDPGGQIVGFDKEIGDALCAKMKVKCEFTNAAWEGIIPGLNANKYDAILSSMGTTEERKKQVNFSDKIYNTPPAIAVPKDSPLKGITPEDLDGVSMGVQTSTIHANYAEEKFKNVDVRRYPSPDEYKLDLANGRIDSAMDDVVVLDTWVKSPEGACCKVLGTLAIDPVIHGSGTGIAVRKEDTDLLDMLNKAIAEIRADGTYKTINDKYFTFNVYGG